MLQQRSIKGFTSGIFDALGCVKLKENRANLHLKTAGKEATSTKEVRYNGH